MEKEHSHMTERILNLTLEIIYLLTGEDYTVMKKTSDKHMTLSSHPAVSRQWNRRQRSIIPERNNKKILEVTNKIIELLMGEVPIRCQDVSVYFSMEEWEYLEGHKDLYGDVMMENRPPLTSPDESRKRNAPERCPRPLYSTQERQEIPQEHQKVPQARPLYSRDSAQVHEEIPLEHQEIPQARPLYSRDSTQEHQHISQARPLDSQDSTQEHQEIPQARPWYSRDTTQEDSKTLQDAIDLRHNITYHYKGDNLIVIKVEDEEDMSVRGDELCKEEEIPPEINTDGRYKKYEHPIITVDGETEDDDIICDSPIENHQVSNFLPAPHSEDLSSDLSIHDVCIIDDLDPDFHRASPGVEKLYPCPQCGKCFTQNSNLVLHQRIHLRTKPYECSACGKTFAQKSHLFTHLRVHTGEKPYPCSLCGKCFRDKANLLRHGRIHREDKPYSCHVCGRCFKDKSNLSKHHRTHTGEKPYSCFECGKCFTRNSHLVAHQRSHLRAKTSGSGWGTSRS